MVNVIFGKAFVDYNNTRYYVTRIVKESHNPIIEAWKDYLVCDTVLKRDGYYYFCQKVDDAQVIEEDGQ